MSNNVEHSVLQYGVTVLYCVKQCDVWCRNRLSGSLERVPACSAEWHQRAKNKSNKSSSKPKKDVDNFHADV